MARPDGKNDVRFGVVRPVATEVEEIPVAYVPPKGWLEVRSELERKNVFHESLDCPEAGAAAELHRVDRPGRAGQCPHCVRHTAAAMLVT
jgi:hypothetical protein